MKGCYPSRINVPFVKMKAAPDYTKPVHGTLNVRRKQTDCAFLVSTKSPLRKRERKKNDCTIAVGVFTSVLFFFTVAILFYETTRKEKNGSSLFLFQRSQQQQKKNSEEQKLCQ